MAQTVTAAGLTVSGASPMAQIVGFSETPVAGAENTTPFSTGSTNRSAAPSFESSPMKFPSSAGTEAAGSGTGVAGQHVPPGTRTAVARTPAARHSALRQGTTANRVAGVRSKATRSSAAAVAAAEQQGGHIDAQLDTADVGRGRCGSSGSASVINSEISPTGKSGRSTRATRSGADFAVSGASATEMHNSSSRSVRRAPYDASGGGAACPPAPQAAGGPTAAPADEPPGAADFRGLRRSVRQAQLATSGKGTSAGIVGGCAPSGTDGHLAAGYSAGGSALVGGPNAGGGRRRMRQPQRQVLQSYVVGQEHQQVGPQEGAQEGTACLAEWLGIESSAPCCCCGSGCASCSTSCSGKSWAICGSSGDHAATGPSTRAGGGGGVRSALDVYTAAVAKRQKQQQQPISGVLKQEQKGEEAEEGIRFCPSWFEASAETDDPPIDFCIVRPTSPNRCAAFFSQQGKWEAQDRLDSAESAAATAGTPWPKGSTSCSYGGYGAATRNGGALPLCCYCGLPLRPPAVGSLRGAGAESGCPLTAAAAAVAALGLEGWTQWCRCCTRVYGDLRLQHQRNAAWLPFASFAIPKTPLRYVMLPADGAKDTPGGVNSLAAAVAAAAAVDPRRSKTVDEGGAGAAAAVAAECDYEYAITGSNGNNSSAMTTASLRRTRSGQHFARAPPSRTSGRSNNNAADTVRFRGASCCWPSSTSNACFIQPIARLQQQLTLLQQQHAESHQLQYRSPIDKADNSAGTRTEAPIVPADTQAVGESAAESSSSAAVNSAVEVPTATSAAAEAPAVSRAAASGDVAVAASEKSESTAGPVGGGVRSDKAPGTPVTMTKDKAKSHSCPTGAPSLRQETAAASSAHSRGTSRPAVIPRVYLESSTSCYVATAFDPVRLQLLQKRFCCSILGEQRAHALACQWLRWVNRSHAQSANKPRLIQGQPCSASAAQTATLPAASSAPSQASDCIAEAATGTSPRRRLMGAGSWGTRRASQRGEASTQIYNPENVRGDRVCKRRKRYEEGGDASDAEGAPLRT